MPAVTRTVNQTVTALVKSFEKDIKAAARDSVISRTEEKKLSPWVQSHIDELRSGNKPVTVAAAMKNLKALIERAAKDIAGSDGKIDARDVAKLRVSDLRNRAMEIFGTGDSTGTGTLPAGKAGIDKALAGITNIADIADYGRHFSFDTYDSTVTPESIVGKVTDNDEDVIEKISTYGDVTKGSAAVTAFISAVNEAANDAAEGVDDTEEANAIKASLKKLADAAKGFFKAADFKQIVLCQHSIAEDGDLESHVLMAQKKDGSWVSLSYTNFPF